MGAAMRICAALVATATLLGGCVATTASVTTPPEGQGGAQRGPFPSAETMAETAPEADAGQPEETVGLSVVEKRHLYARRVMASCVEYAPSFETGLQNTALNRTTNLSSGAAAFADPVFQVAASTDGRRCDVRALGGSLDRFAEGMEIAFRSRGELTAWARQGDGYSGVLVIEGQQYRVSAEEMVTDRGNIMVGRVTRG